MHVLDDNVMEHVMQCDETCDAYLIFRTWLGFIMSACVNFLKLLIPYVNTGANMFLNSLSSYNAVMESWQLAFSWDNVTDFQIQDVRIRVLSSMAWVTMKAYVDIGNGPFNVTNIYELHNGRWYMVHHHSSALLIHGGGEQQLLHV